MPADPYRETPDGRYFVVRGRLWRKSNCGLGWNKESFGVIADRLARLPRDALN